MRLKKITALFLTGALILSMAGCAGNGSKDKKEGSAGNEAQEPVKIATKPMTEQFILGEMLKKLIEEKAGYEVELTKGIGGGTSNIQPAMEKGEFDLYPEYTSSGWILVLGHKAGEVSDDKMLAKLQEEYGDDYFDGVESDGPADHDLYEDDFDEEDTEIDELDAFDEFLDSEAVMQKEDNPNPDAAKEDMDDDEEEDDD